MSQRIRQKWQWKNVVVFTCCPSVFGQDCSNGNTRPFESWCSRHWHFPFSQTSTCVSITVLRKRGKRFIFLKRLIRNIMYIFEIIQLNHFKHCGFSAMGYRRSVSSEFAVGYNLNDIPDFPISHHGAWRTQQCHFHGKQISIYPRTQCNMGKNVS